MLIIILKNEAKFNIVWNIYLTLLTFLDLGLGSLLVLSWLRLWLSIGWLSLWLGWLSLWLGISLVAYSICSTLLIWPIL